MHCQLLLRVMRHNGLGAMLDDPKHGVHFRKVLWESVIATDMGVHKNFMERFKDLVDGEAGTLSLRQILVCQALLKNADISNPVRCHTHLITMFQLFAPDSTFQRIKALGNCSNARVDSASATRGRISS